MSITDQHPRTDSPAAGTTIDLTSPETRGSAGEGDAGPSQADRASRPQFTITDAATACAVSRKTITRKLGDLAEHGAAKDEDGIWRIPVEALLAVGLHPGRSMPERPADRGHPTREPGAAGPRTAQPAAPDMVTIPRDRWDDLRIRLARAEAQAAERDSALADARLALRALTAGPHLQSPQAMAASSDEPTGGVAVTGTGGPEAAVPSGSGSVPGPVVVGGPPTPDAGPPSHPPVAVAPPAAASPAPPATAVGAPTSELAQARSQAARTGGYVPAANQPAKRRRWWHSK